MIMSFSIEVPACEIASTLSKIKNSLWVLLLMDDGLVRKTESWYKVEEFSLCIGELCVAEAHARYKDKLIHKMTEKDAVEQLVKEYIFV